MDTTALADIFRTTKPLGAVVMRWDGRVLRVDAIRITGYDADPETRRRQLARRVLIESMDGDEPIEPLVAAFADEVLARLPDEWTMLDSAVRGWLAARGGR